MNAELREAFDAVLANGRYILGPWTERFESAFAEYCGADHAVGVANGTDALELALRAADCGPGDDVITVANAGGYATSAILYSGARPVYADIDPHSFLITPATFLQAITVRTKAVVITHLYGLMADMPALCEAAAQRGILIIEDCAQAHGASMNGKKAGVWGAFGCFSFYPTKNLGGLGDAGCIISNDKTLAERVRSLRQYGWQQEKYHSVAGIGCNSRIDELQAAILTRLLPYLDDWNTRRRQIINTYKLSLRPYGVSFQKTENTANFAAHLCVVSVPRRERLMHSLWKEGIETVVHFPLPDYAQQAVIQRLGQTAPLTVTEEVLPTILSLPCFPEMTVEEVNHVTAAVRRHMSAQVAA